MLKCFSNLPAELEKYNPDILDMDFSESESHDNQGRLHSFNDQPAKVIRNMRNEFRLTWYSHGKLSRRDKPVEIFIRQNHNYSTYDENGQLHSYNDQPSEIYYTNHLDRTELTWSNHGQNHRDNNLPAFITWFGERKIISDAESVNEEIYYVNNERHRENGLPAYISENIESWSIHGGNHNTKGKALSFLRDSLITYNQWGLYGIEMNEELFNRIVDYQKKTEVPLWVALLYIIQVVDDDQLNFFKTESGTWYAEIPAAWILRAWGVTDEALKSSVSSRYGKNLNINFSIRYNATDSQLENFLKIVKFDEETLIK